MRYLSSLALCLVLAACVSCNDYDKNGDKALYEPQAAEDGYKPAKTGRVFHAAGYDIPEGQQMRDFFDDFEEPMHAKYIGNNVIAWTYYINRENGDIVRYCELDKFSKGSLCQLNVKFYRTYVSSASSDCQ